MQKSEWVIFEVLKGNSTQKAIAVRLGISLSTVHHALIPLVRIGAVETRRFGFRLRDREKTILFWASLRNMEKDTVYQTRAEASITEMECLMPSGIVFTAYSAFRLRYHDGVPADYSEVYVYADEKELVEVKKRFPPREGPANLIVLTKPKIVRDEKIAPNELLFVDLWNLKEWYAREFVTALKKKMGMER